MNGWMPLALGASGITAVAVMFWNQLKAVLVRGLSHVFVVNKCSLDVTLTALAHLNVVAKRSPYGGRAFESIHAFVRPLGRIRTIVVQIFASGGQVYWLGRWPIWVSVDGPKAGHESREPSGASLYPATFSYIRGTVDWDALLLAAADREDERLTQLTQRGPGRYRITRFFGRGAAREGNEAKLFAECRPPGGEAARYGAGRLLRWSSDDIGPRQSRAALDMLSLGPGLKVVVEEIRFWYAEKAWYEARGIPWRRGYLFHGGPGTGKTSFARALAEDLDLPVYVFDLASMQNSEFIPYWQMMLASTPCIALLEDIDAVFHGRDNVTNQFRSGGLTFDCLLNCLDGVERPDGLLTIVTTNQLEHLDPALGRPEDAQGRLESAGTSSRPGRIDQAVRFEALDEAGRYKMAMRIVRDEAAAQRVMQDGVGDSVVQFQERCIQLALAVKFEQRREESRRAA